MHQLKISTRLAILTGILSVLLVAIGAMGLLGISQSNDALKTVYEDRTVCIGQIAEIHRLNLSNQLLIANSLLHPFPADVSRDTAEVEANIATISKTWDAYMATVLTPEEAKIARQLGEDRARFVREGLRPALAALHANDLITANRLVDEKTKPLYAPLSADIAALMQLQLDVAKAEYNAAIARYANFRLWAIGSILAGLLTAMMFGAALMHSISRSLRQAVAMANAIAQGDLHHPIETQGNNEVAQLMQAMSTMQANLADVVSQVRQGSENVATASAQIASGNQDLSSRTEQQASALQETAASMEELSVTVKQNAESAVTVKEMALLASAKAATGGEVVALVVDTMREINESGQKIADIIGVMESISFQTNILALNASIEAARAGEQGRGFAVVASEVRSLASRSTEAARDIKELIHTSVQRVAEGVELVNQAGFTMTEVVSSIKNVSNLVGEISAASNEQSLGVSQIGEAVMQMDQMTQQNAALVEEMAAAASSLKTQANDLVGTMAVFKLSTGDSTHLMMVRSAVPREHAFNGAEKRAPAMLGRNAPASSIQF